MKNTVTYQRIRNAGVAFTATAIAIAIGLIIVAVSANNFSTAISAFISGMFGNAYAVGASLNRSVVFGLVGLGFIFANRANLVNVGGEGQIALGGIAATAVALHGHVSHLPFGLPWILSLGAGLLAGAIWGGIAGFLRIRRGTNEVISTLLLDFIGVLLVYWCVQSTYLLRQPETSSSTLPQSAQIPDSTVLPTLYGANGSPLHIGLIIGIILGIVVWLMLTKTTIGVRLQAIGFNAQASYRAGISVNRHIMSAMFVSGGLGGLAGAMMILGSQWYLSAGFTSGYGFDGLVVGLLARGSVTGVLLAALFFGFIQSGGLNMQMISGVPQDVVVIIQGLVVVLIAGAYRFFSNR